MSYTISVLPSAERDLLKLPARDWRRIRNRIDGLAENPRPYGSQSYGERKTDIVFGQENTEYGTA